MSDSSRRRRRPAGHQRIPRLSVWVLRLWCAMQLMSACGRFAALNRTRRMCSDVVNAGRRNAEFPDGPGDTSVWIRFLANGAPYATELDRLLSVDEVAGHELVYGELLIGDRGGRRKLLTIYERIYQASFVPHLDVVAFVRDRDLHGRGVGWIDIHLLPSAIVGSCGCGRPTRVSLVWLMN